MNITEQALDLASGTKVDPEAMQPPGLPVPADPGAVSLFTAHRVDEIQHKLSHAAGRMKAARAASGDLRKYHAARLGGHLDAALGAAHDLTAHVKQHYPAEAAELEQVRQTVGLAKAVSDDARAATTAHLTETSLHELTHASRHAGQMTEETPDDEFDFNAGHAAKHLGGAVEHAGKLRQHLKDNYPDVAAHLNALDEARSGTGDDSRQKQHARYAGSVSAQMANEDTITGQARLDLNPVTFDRAADQ